MSTPPTLLEEMLECTAKIEELRMDESMTKKDVLDSWEARMSVLMSRSGSIYEKIPLTMQRIRLVCTPMATSFCLWRTNAERDTSDDALKKYGAGLDN